MPLNQTVKEDKIDIFYWSPDSAKWYLTDVGKREGDKVTFYVDHFSTYAAMTGGWSDFFGQLDAAVGDKTGETAISEAVKSVLKEVYDSQFDGYHFATRANMGGQAVSICAEACGIFGFWAKEENGSIRQGGGTYKQKSQHNIITSIGYSDAESLKGEKITAITFVIGGNGHYKLADLTPSTGEMDEPYLGKDATDTFREYRLGKFFKSVLTAGIGSLGTRLLSRCFSNMRIALNLFRPPVNCGVGTWFRNMPSRQLGDASIRALRSADMRRPKAG